MSEIKKQFTGGKMNKDVDERLVPTGEYRDAMNIQVSTSEGSDVGTIQNILGNMHGCDADNNFAIGDDAFTVGSISDEKNDTLYWLISGNSYSPESVFDNNSSWDSGVAMKDFIWQYSSVDGCKPVFVDKYGFSYENPNPTFTFNSNILSGIPIEAYEEMQVGWTVVGVTNDGMVSNTAIITGIAQPQGYYVDYGFTTQTTPSITTTYIGPNGMAVGSGILIPIGRKGPGFPWTQSTGNIVYITNFSGNVSGLVGDQITILPYNTTNSQAFTINAAVSTNVMFAGGSGLNVVKLTLSANLALFSPIFTTPPSGSIIAGTGGDGALVGMYNGSVISALIASSGMSTNNIATGELMVQGYDVSNFTVGDQIYFNGGQQQAPGYYCVTNITLATNSIYLADCTTGTVISGWQVGGSIYGVPQPFGGGIIIPADNDITLDQNLDLTTNPYTTIYLTGPRVLNFNHNELITGINIIDDMLFWTDGRTEPKRINIPRSILGTHYSANFHTRLINPDQGISYSDGIMAREEHVTVIRKSPRNALSLELETGRDASLNYTGITSIGAPTSITAPITISDFSSIAIGDTISFNINADYDFNTTFSLAWQPGQFILLKEAPDTSNLPGIPLANWKIRGRILSQASNNFDSANGIVNVTIEIVGLNGVPDDPDPSVGYLNYIVELENTEPSIFEDKFPRFSYRYKYSDNEYSTFAPWSEVAFLPTTFDYDPKKGWNKGMVNNIRFIKISGFRPSVYGLPAGKDVIEVDILYKEDSSPNVYLVETISPVDILQSGLSTIPWYSDEYIIDSETIKSTIASNQLLRPWDNVPKKALAQEVSGNRVIYGNYEQNYDLKVGGLKYKPDFINSLVAWGGVSAGSPQKSIKSLRDYKLGVVFTDKYGRETPVIISENGGFKVDKQQSINANRLTVGLTGQPPAEMAFYKFYVKETSTEYYSIAMDRWYAAEDGNIWLAFPSSDRNKVDLDTSLYFKKGNDGDNNAIENSTKYKVLALENEAPEWIKTKRVRIGTVNHNVSGDSQIFGVTGSTTTNAPTVGGISFTMEYGGAGSNQDFISTTLSHMEDIKEDIYVQFVRAGDRSAQYKVSEITSDRDVLTGIPEHYFVTLDKAFEEDINFIFDVPASPNEILDDTRIIFTKAVIENKPQFDGRFFAKIENDGKIQTMISEDSLGFNYITSSEMKVYVLDDDHGSGRNDSDVSAHAWTVSGLSYGGNDMIRQDYCSNVVNGCSTNLANYLAPVDQNSYAGQLDNPNGYNFNALFARKAYFQDVWGTSTNGLNAANNLGEPGVWFIDRSTRLYTVPSTGCDSNSLNWPNTSNMNHMSPSCNNPYWSDWSVPSSCGAPYPDHTGITNYSDTSNVKISFGPIWHSGLIDQSIVFADGSGGWYTTSTMTDFFGIGTTNSLYNDSITSKFVSNLNAGSIFKWKEDPTETIYTIEDQTACKNFCRFGRFSSGKHNGQSNHNFSGTEHFEDPSSYTKQWSFNVNKSMAGWDPAGPVGTYMTNGLHLGDATGPARHTKTTTVDLFPGSAILNLLDTNGLKPGMSAMHADLPLNCKIVSVLPSSVTLSTGPTAQIFTFSTVDFGFTIRIVGGSIYANTVAGGPIGTNPQENYIIVDNIKTECSNSNNLKPIYYLQKGMALAAYNLDTLPNNGGTEASTTDIAIIKKIHLQDSSGNFKIDLAGYWTPLQGGMVWDDGSAGFLINERMLFKQITMNGASNYTEHNTDKSLQHHPKALVNGLAGAVGAVGYTMEFLDVVDQYSDGGYLPEDPFVWETEPKDNTELDIYYEISENNPTVLNPDTINIAIPVGSKVASIAGAGGISDNTYVSSVGGTSGNQIVISELAWIGPGNAPGIGTQPLVNGSILEITKPNGVVFSVQIQNIVQMPAPPYDVSSIFELNPTLFNSEYKLNWHNCWSFGNGVESNRIKDTFNSPFIGHGVKVSTTSDDYKKEHRKSGLIYSGLYNSTSGINNLNQFIQAEKITKDVNPTYGSIRKLYAGWGHGGDLIALCEDRVLKILANKDALYNADGNSNITSTNNVLGTATPFAGNYGISENPESFASESFRAYFTDKVRGAVIRLSMDGLTAISDHGMKDWFRDNLKLNNKLVGSYDDKKDEYNITLQQTTEQTPKTVSFREDVRGWVSFKSFVPENAISCSNEYYTFLDGKLWKHHDENVDRNTFYGLPLVNTSFTAILNDVPGSIKSFNTINYEGSQSRVVINLQDNDYYNLVQKDGWYVDSIFTDKESGAIDEFIEKEGKWFNHIRGNDVVHFTSFDPNGDPFTGVDTDTSGNFSL
jgi:hypothetical protein